MSYKTRSVTPPSAVLGRRLTTWTEKIYDDNGDGTGTYYAIDRDGNVIQSGTDVFVLLRAITDGWPAGILGGAIFIDRGEFSGSSHRTVGGANYLIEAPDNKAFAMWGHGIKTSKFKYTGAQNNVSLFQSNPSQFGVNNPQSGSNVRLEHLGFNINRELTTVPFLNIENTYQRFCQYLRIVNDPGGNPDPPQAGSRGIKCQFSGGERSSFENITLVGAEFGFDQRSDHSTLINVISSYCKSGGFTTQNSVFATDYIHIHSFSCGGNGFFCNNGGTDTPLGHYPRIWSLLDENEGGLASFDAKVSSINNSQAGAIVQYLNVMQRGMSSPYAIPLFAGAGQRNILPITTIAPASIIGFGTSGEYPQAFVGFAGGARREYGLPAPTVTGTETFNNSAASKMFGNYATGAVAGNDAGLHYANVLRGDMEYDLVVRFRMPSVASIRGFIGFADQTLPTMVGADNPAGNYVGLQFSTPRADTNFKCVSKDNVTQNLVDFHVPAAGYPADTNNYVFGMNVSGTRYTLYLVTPSGHKLNGFRASMANTPAATVVGNLVAGIETEAAAVKNLEITAIRVLY